MADEFTTTWRPGTPVYKDNLVKYVRAGLLETVRTGLPWLPAGAVDFSAYKSGTDDTYVLPGIGDLSDTLIPTPDEISPPPIEELESYQVSFGTTEYHRAVGWSSTTERTQPFQMGSTVAERVRRAVEVAMDSVARNVWLAGVTGLPHIGSGTATLTRDTLVDIATTMRSLEIPPLPDGTYGLLVPPGAVGDLFKESGEKSLTAILQETDPKAFTSGVIGTVNGIKIITSTRVPVGAGPGFVSEGIAFGSQALAFADLGSVQVYVTMPKPSIADPTARKGVAAYVFRAGGTLIGRKVTHDSATRRYNAIAVDLKATTPTTTPQA